MGRYIKGVVTGAIVGTAVGMMILPELNRKQHRSVRKMGRKLVHAAGEGYDDMMHWMR
ncbi:MAG: YtxH domain-containing protein [Clostridium sp.]